MREFDFTFCPIIMRGDSDFCFCKFNLIRIFDTKLCWVESAWSWKWSFVMRSMKCSLIMAEFYFSYLNLKVTHSFSLGTVLWNQTKNWFFPISYSLLWLNVFDIIIPFLANTEVREPCIFTLTNSLMACQINDRFTENHTVVNLSKLFSFCCGAWQLGTGRCWQLPPPLVLGPP